MYIYIITTCNYYCIRVNHQVCYRVKVILCEYKVVMTVWMKVVLRKRLKEFTKGGDPNLYSSTVSMKF